MTAQEDGADARLARWNSRIDAADFDVFAVPAKQWFGEVGLEETLEEPGKVLELGFVYLHLDLDPVERLEIRTSNPSLVNRLFETDERFRSGWWSNEGSHSPRTAPHLRLGIATGVDGEVELVRSGKFHGHERGAYRLWTIRKHNLAVARLRFSDAWVTINVWNGQWREAWRFLHDLQRVRPGRSLLRRLAEVGRGA